ncbi:initiator NS1 family protein [Rhodopirellula halodulae]|uniref:initiator NS1 family protein n=1 Tax=Rhodopirellula halodulae TaxID=2894198 RepID=UPI001E4C9F77|nr:initiator NS1 family protein [Rhodopirellula sp. JC737]MCC9658805.1 initiator NS1 family protein [Rhodopirellula sp. JC737]
MPAEATDALRNGSAFELLSLDPSYLDAEQRPNDFHNWNTLGATPVSRDDRTKIAELLIASVPENPGAIAACFNPRHGIRVVHDNQQFDFVICFECLQIYWYIDDEKQPTILTSGSPLPAFNGILRGASIPLADPA